MLIQSKTVGHMGYIVYRYTVPRSYIRTYIHTYIHIHTYIQTYIHAYTTCKTKTIPDVIDSTICTYDRPYIYVYVYIYIFMCKYYTESFPAPDLSGARDFLQHPDWPECAGGHL